MENVGCQLFTTVVRREHVQAADISPITEIIRRREGEADQRCPRAQTIAFHVDGFSDDPRELFEIPEVRHWFRVLDNALPHLLYFLSPLSHMHTVYAACFVANDWRPGAGTIEFDVAQFNDWFVRRLCAVAFYCWRRGGDPKETVESVAGVYGVEIDAEAFLASTLATLEAQTHVLEEQNKVSVRRLREYTHLASQADQDTATLLRIADAGDPADAERVVAALNRATWAQAEVLAQAIPWFGEDAVPHLAKTAYGKRKSGIYCSLRALGRIGGASALAVVCKRLEDLPTKAEAIEALVDMGALAVPRLLAYTGHAKAEIRELAAYALGKLGVQDARGRLQAMASTDRSGTVRQAAQRSLSWLDGEPCEMDLRGQLPIIEL
jgi:hypothetical protein